MIQHGGEKKRTILIFETKFNKNVMKLGGSVFPQNPKNDSIFFFPTPHKRTRPGCYKNPVAVQSARGLKQPQGREQKQALMRQTGNGVSSVCELIVKGGWGSLSLHVPRALRLSCGRAEVLPAERGQQHGGRQVHWRQVVGPGGEAGPRQGRLLLDYSQDVQSLVPGRIREGDLL